MTAVSLEGVTLRYPGAARMALESVTLRVDAGAVTWLFGRLGAGCSSLLLVAAGLAPRHTGGVLSGDVRMLGTDPQTAAGRRELAGRIAWVTASPSLQLSGVAETVWQEIAFAPANLGWPADRIREAVPAALTRMGIAHLSERHPAELSGGETQRVVLAAMAVLAPLVWLLDEPASALDRQGRRTLAALLRMEVDRGAAVVVASEDADWMLDLADRMVVLLDGAVVLDGAPQELLATDAIWTAAGASTAIATLARAAAATLEPAPAALMAPYPLTLDEGLARWM